MAVNKTVKPLPLRAYFLVGASQENRLHNTFASAKCYGEQSVGRAGAGAAVQGNSCVPLSQLSPLPTQRGHHHPNCKWGEWGDRDKEGAPALLGLPQISRKTSTFTMGPFPWDFLLSSWHPVSSRLVGSIFFVEVRTFPSMSSLLFLS